MFQYVMRRLLLAVPMLLGAMSIVFFAMRVLPGDPCVAMMGDQATTEALADCTRNVDQRLVKPASPRGIARSIRRRMSTPHGLARIARPPAHAEEHDDNGPGQHRTSEQ